jgi:phosphate-selective porin OprO/OprP
VDHSSRPGYCIGAWVPLFGGQRRFDRNRATWTRPRFEPLDPQSNTWGFAELAMRYSSATLNDGSVRGGRQAVNSVALNYYPSSQFRVSVQYSNGSIRLDGPDRDFQAIAVRLGFNL